MQIQSVNRVELLGFVGSCRTTEVGGKTLAHFTVATNHVYTNAEGITVIETTWHQCSAWNQRITLSKGDKVHLVGRIRNQRYTGTDGQERSLSEIIVSSLEIAEP